MKEKDRIEYRVNFIPSGADLVLEEVVAALGKEYEQTAIEVYIFAAREYRRDNVPRFHAREEVLKKIYEGRMETYATEAVREWIQLQQRGIQK